MDLDVAIEKLDMLLSEHPSLEVRDAWRVIRRHARRTRRVSQTLPRIAWIAQRAVAVREAIDQFIPALPPTLYQAAATAREHVLAILEIVSTGHDESDIDDSIV